jgi:hypothetical protein
LLSDKKYEIQGKLEEALELLNLFTRESKDDAKEIKLKVKETNLEMDTAGSRIKT